MDRTPKTYEYGETQSAGARPVAGSSHALMLKLVGRGKDVLEFGCATGYMSQMFVQAGCRVVGVELNPVMALEAQQFCEQVVVADLDARPLDDLLPERKFDVAVFGDVLEHLRDPWRVLDESRPFIAPGGYAVLSIPNVAHGSVRLALLSGSFEYAEAGLLDDTHIRFFTLESIADLCARAGYRIDAIERTTEPIFSASPLLPHVHAEDFDPATIARVASDPEAETFQFVIRASPLDDDQKRESIHKSLVLLRAELEDARRRERAAPSVAMLEALQNEIDGLRVALAQTEANLRDLEAQNARADVASRERAEYDRMALTLANAELRIDLASRTFERDLADVKRARANDTIALAKAELHALRDRIAEYRATEGRHHDEAARLFEEIAALRGQVADLTANYVDHQERTELERRLTRNHLSNLEVAFEAQEHEFAELGVLHRGLSEVAAERERLLVLREAQRTAAAAELADARAELAAERKRRIASESIFAEFLAYEIGKARHQSTIVDGMIAGYRSSKWWSLKKALRRLRSRD